MLGFSPLASAPLADTGAIAEAAFGLDDIVAGAPTVAASTISQGHVLTSDDITAGVPTVADATATSDQALTSVDITTGAPVIGSPDLDHNHVLTGADIVTGVPTVEALHYCPSQHTNGSGHCVRRSDCCCCNGG